MPKKGKPIPKKILCDKRFLNSTEKMSISSFKKKKKTEAWVTAMRVLFVDSTNKTGFHITHSKLTDGDKITIGPPSPP